ncbi:hypothetical protein LLH06_14200 [Mucilaginibacter daejeonensis]|uniref:pirin family protein n=1 Tax=Mucilaginibacter daejeonensis TaxID=398049 RepID=UPI001D17AD45|nr:hypothetical protein [Mucilaginibacter daejeonensis]UEG52114.1 hypothetical protein LLH06_14200 [Mucilaginibacter daejeonensis]
MTQLTPGQIYLADQRGVFEDAQKRRFSTFNYSNYYYEHRSPRSDLRVFNEWYLAPQARVELSVEQEGYLILLPLTGELICQINGVGPTSVNVDEVLMQYVSAGTRFCLIDPDSKESVNFLHVEVSSSAKIDLDFVRKVPFDLASSPDKLLLLTPYSSEIPIKLHVGYFAGRKETVCQLSGSSSVLFAFVMNGAFEIQGRLLHKGDGLALWDTTETDIEALSENAVLLTFESS